MIKPFSVILLAILTALGACRDAPKEMSGYEEELMWNLLGRAGYRPNMAGEGYFVYKTYGLDHTESYKDLTLSLAGGGGAAVCEIYSPKKGGRPSRVSYNINQAEAEALLKIINSGGFWSPDIKFEQTSLGGGVAVLGGWRAGVVKLHSNIPPEAPLLKAEAWFEGVSEPPEPGGKNEPKTSSLGP